MRTEKTERLKTVKLFHNRSLHSLEEVRETPSKTGNGNGLKKSDRLKTCFQTVALFSKQALHAGLLPAAMPFASTDSSSSAPLCPSLASAVVKKISTLFKNYSDHNYSVIIPPLPVRHSLGDDGCPCPSAPF